VDGWGGASRYGCLTLFHQILINLPILRKSVRLLVQLRQNLLKWVNDGTGLILLRILMQCHEQNLRFHRRIQSNDFTSVKSICKMYGYRDMSILVPCRDVLCSKCTVNHWTNIYLANCKFTLVLTAEAWKHTYIQQDSITAYIATNLTAATSAMAEYIPYDAQIFFRMNLDIFLMLSFKTLSQNTANKVTNH
jgi:hypothetical protein